MDNREAQVDVESLARWRRSTSSRSGNAAATASTLILSGQLVYGNCADWVNLISIVDVWTAPPRASRSEHVSTSSES